MKTRCYSWLLAAMLVLTNLGVHAQQTAQVKGSVLSETGELLSGVSIVCSLAGEAERQSSVTNEKGMFTIPNLKAGSRYNFTFSYVGYQNNAVANYLVNGGDNNSILVRMQLAKNDLNDVVVVGYGTKQKNAVTGAISSIKGSEFGNRPVTQASQIFYGLIPGVFANANTGEAGNGQTTIRIRGVGTLNDASALILVDGIEAPIDNISPNDIESVTVLKDAAAAAIYGSRAANGVVLVTTKRGKFNSKIKVDYNGYYGISRASVLPKMVTDNVTYLQLYKEAAINTNVSVAGITDADIERYRTLPSTNWFDVIFDNNAPIQEHTVGMRAGNENLSTYVSLGYLNQTGIIKKTGFERYNTRINLDAKINKYFKAGASFAYSYSDADLATKEGPEYSTNSTDVNSLNNKGSLAFESAITQHPIVPVYDSLGRYATLEQKLGIQRNRNNGQAILDNEFLKQKENKLLGNVYLSYEPVSNLVLKATLGLNDQQTGYVDTRKQYQNYDPVTSRLVSTIVPGSFLTDVQEFSKNVTTLLQASYERKIGKHSIGGLVGFNQEIATQKRNATLQTGFSTTSLVTLGNGATTLVANARQGEWALRSIFGRINYEYAGKYLVEANIRRDGSSRFGENNRFGVFPSFSAGWIVSNEQFWNKNIINFLKLRASYGTLGNQNTALYPFASQVVLSSNYAINNTNTSGGSINVLGNPDLKWESTTTTDIGAHIELFKSKITIEADYFVRTTKDILTSIPNPLTLGIPSATIVNAATVENKGWELSGNYNFKIGALNASIGGNVTYVENKVTTINPALSPEDDKVELNGPGNIWLIRNQPINAIFGYKVAGIFQTADEIAKAPNHSRFGTPQPGDFRFQDTDGDGVITNNDRVVLGNRQPKWLYGFSLKLNVKGFDFGALFQGVGEFNYFQARQVGPFAFAGIRAFWKDRWTPDNPSTTLPRIWIDRSGYNGGTIETQPASFWVQNLAYLRLKNLQIGYTLPRTLLTKIKIENIRIYANAQNLFTFTKYIDFDPERLATQQYVTNSLPQLKIITGGINVTF
jgi:TonB-dependent starch-binding outer membrane protein SusC